MPHTIIKQLNETGSCVVDIDALEKAWDHRFWLSQLNNEFRLVKYVRKGSEKTEIKCTLSDEQAREIIARLKLKQTQGNFISSSSWRKEGGSEADMQTDAQRAKIAGS